MKLQLEELQKDLRTNSCECDVIRRDLIAELAGQVIHKSPTIIIHRSYIPYTTHIHVNTYVVVYVSLIITSIVSEADLSMHTAGCFY